MSDENAPAKSDPSVPPIGEIAAAEERAGADERGGIPAAPPAGVEPIGEVAAAMSRRPS